MGHKKAAWQIKYLVFHRFLAVVQNDASVIGAVQSSSQKSCLTFC
jgi:hypothetical protein